MIATQSAIPVLTNAPSAQSRRPISRRAAEPDRARSLNALHDDIDDDADDRVFGIGFAHQAWVLALIAGHRTG